MDNGFDLYNLKIEAGHTCFYNFNPANYHRLNGYDKDPIFSDKRFSSLLHLANTALVFFTRAGSNYESRIQSDYSFISIREKKKKPPVFSAYRFMAFDKDESDFEEAIKFCLKIIYAQREIEDSPLINDDVYEPTDFIILRNILLDEVTGLSELPCTIEPNTEINNVTYLPEHLFSIFALWKIDRVITAIQNNQAEDTAKLLLDVHLSLNESQWLFDSKIRSLRERQEFKGEKSKAAQKGPEYQRELKAKVIQLYWMGNDGNPWRSYKRAAETIYNMLKKQEPSLVKNIAESSAIRTWSTPILESVF